MNRNSSLPPGPARARASKASARILTEKQVEALTVAMIVAPGVYARNRMFDLFTSAGARRARTRASAVRGMVPQLARASAVTVSLEALGHCAGELAQGAVPKTFVLRYAVSAVRLTRVVELSAAELAALRLALSRANIHVLPPADGDAALVTATLASLMEDDASRDAVRLASGIPAPLGE